MPGGGLRAVAGTLTDRQLAAESILSYEAGKAGAATIAQWLREELPPTMGVGGEWYAFALAQQGVKLPECREALEAYLASHTVRSATSRLKFQLVRLALGGDISPDWHEDILRQGVISRAGGLHLLNNGCDAPITATEVIAELLTLQLEDGGWAITALPHTAIYALSNLIFLLLAGPIGKKLERIRDKYGI